MANGTVGQRMRWVREQAKPRLTRERLGIELAQRLDRPRPYTQQAVEQWEKDINSPDLNVVVAFASLTGCDLHWLMTGIVGMTVNRNGVGSIVASQTSLPGGRVVSIITADQILQMPIDYKSKEQVHTHNPCSAKSFSFRVFDRGNAPAFQTGDRVVIDPVKKAEPGDMVFAAIDGEAVFGKFVHIARRGKTKSKAIEPLNKDWGRRELSRGDRIIGVMVEHTAAGSRPRGS